MVIIFDSFVKKLCQSCSWARKAVIYLTFREIKLE